MDTACVSRWAGLTTPPPDSILGLKEVMKQDPKPESIIDLTVGAYRTADGEPWVLPPVAAARRKLEASNMTHEYLPIDGLPEFNRAAEQLLYGASLANVDVATVQALSGTGALRLVLEFMRRHGPRQILIPKVTWANHYGIARDAGYAEEDQLLYAYVDASGRGLDWEGLLRDVGNAPAGSLILLHLCAHNPTGIDPTPQQWAELAVVVRAKELVPIFDSAYLGFATGDVDADAAPFRLFVDAGLAPWATVSFSKNFGLYSERTGAVHATTESADSAVAVRENLKALARAMYSNPPAFGARVVATVLGDEKLRKEWFGTLKTMSSRIGDMRWALRNRLEQNGTPGTWDHVTSQIGMFSFTGLTPKQCLALRADHHVYLLLNGRISMAGLNAANVHTFADAITATLLKEA
ncbi:pyridoxal phosphate-dependent transferase [Pelagophyceae sp. CCMP2097]|nr:pyridoxal phosphate-dependent transferase [Pelagophyceae sp. CCMP2097]